MTPMKKPRLALTMAAVACFLLIVSLLFTVLQLTVNDRAWFSREYEKLGLSASIGLSNEDAAAAILRLVDYMEGRVSSIQLSVEENGSEVLMYNEREMAHMVDVRALYQGWRTVRTAGFLLALALLVGAYFLYREGFLSVLARGFLRAAAAFLVLTGAVGAFAAADFNAFWTAFHHLFFTNELWLLDPATDRMIRICPEVLFSDIVLRFLVIFLACMAALLTLAALFRKARCAHGR